jgi:hypothetical protein
MYHFCTYFDQNYLLRGLALYHSLKKHCPEFKLWVLCMDNATCDILEKLSLAGVQPISLEEFERNDEPLRSAKQNRSRIEYYFTCTPSVPLYILKNWPQVNFITYLDADLFFFSSPAPLFEELRDGSVAIIGHRFSPALRRLKKNGIYNVGWLSFRRDLNALACLNWWRQKCIEWCYDHKEDGRFADQKYLDDWPNHFQNVVVLEHKGANLALWNLANYRLHCPDSNAVMVDDQVLIFFHFHGLKKVNGWLYDPCWKEYQIKPPAVLRKKIYALYIRTLFDIKSQLSALGFFPNSASIRNGTEQPEKQVSQVRTLLSVGKSMLTGRYFFVVNGNAIYLPALL